jgi:predicted nucleotidyltransferase
MALSQSERTGQIRRFLGYLQKEIVVERAILYGSSARGQTHSESDIDLAVLSPNFVGLDWFSRLRFLLRAAWKAGTDWIEPVGYTPQEFDASQPGTFIEEIKNHGIVIYDRTIRHTAPVAHEPGISYETDGKPV